MKKHNVKAAVLFAILGTASVPAFAAPDINSILVSGFLRRSSGTVVASGSYTTTVTIRDGSGNVAGCTVTPAAPGVDVQDGYFSVPVNCTSTQLNAATGALTARVSILLDGVTETFDVSARPVPTALVAGIANGVAANAVTSAGIAAGAVTNTAITDGTLNLAKLSPTGAANGDVITRVGGVWTFGTPASLNLPATNSTNTYTAAQTFGAAGTGLSVTNSATIGTGLTVTSGGATITAGGLTVGGGGITATGNSTITGDLSVTNLTTTGTTTSGGALTVTTGGATVTAGGLTVSGGGSAITGNETVSGTSTIGTGLTVTSGGATITAGDATVTAGNLNITAGTVRVSTRTAASAATYGAGVAALAADRSVIFLTGATASAISCISAGAAGQRLTVVFTTNNVAGTGYSVLHNQACTTAHPVWTNTAATVASAGANTSAVLNFVSNGTYWYLIANAP